MNKCTVCDFEIPEDIFNEHVKNCKEGKLKCHFCTVDFQSNLESRLAHLRKCQRKQPIILINPGTESVATATMDVGTSTEDVTTKDVATSTDDLTPQEHEVIVIEDDADIVSITPLFQRQETDVFDLNDITVEPMDSQTGSEPLASVEELYNMYLAYIDGIF